jgi:hypothetical protein
VLVTFVATARCAAASMVTTDDGSYLAALLDRADRERLHERREWRLLGHYAPGARGGVASLAHGERFFFSRVGRTDPRAELHETLSAFFDPARFVRDGEPPVCAFPARWAWLARELEIDASRLPAVSCERYEKWREGLDARGITLVFPEAYMNNPASMFGHTLLRVDSSVESGDRELLAYAINFAAEAGNDGGIAFAFKGIFGGYDGFFSVLPYYEKLEQYGDWENRDIWEYPLRLTEPEIDTLLAHVWELRGVPFRYFFFDDNCSYQLLALLEIARPGLDLLSFFPLWAIPIDTVRVVAEETDLIAGAKYRASPATRIRYRAQRTPAPDRILARDLALGDVELDAAAMAETSPQRRAEAASLAYAYLRYLYYADEISRENSAARSLGLLAEVSRTDRATEVQEPRAPGTPPQRGHASARVGVGGGVRADEGFVEISLRPVFHSLSDPPAGFVEGAHLEIGRVAVRYEPERGRLRLEELALVDVSSLTARDTFLRPVSWSFATGWRTRMLSDGSGDGVDPRGVAYLAGGAGAAYAWSQDVLGYSLLRGIVEAGSPLRDDYALAPGAEAGALWRGLDDRARSRFVLQAFRYVAGDTTTALRAAAEGTLALSDRVAVVMEVAGEHAYGETWWSATLSWRSFFRRRWGASSL